VLLATLIGIVLFAIWAFVTIDIIRRPDLTTGHKVLWALFVFILPAIGAIVYVAKRPESPHDRYDLPGEMPHESVPGSERISSHKPY
jgi:hypothetical protein